MHRNRWLNGSTWGLQEKASRVWLYRPASHKTEHRGHERVIELVNRSQSIIRPFLTHDLGAYVLSPADAEATRRAALHAKRETPMSCGNVPGSNRRRKPQQTPKDRYTPDSYRRAVTRACELAGVPAWFPHQLRHNYATMIRRQYGIETARILLGHHSVACAELYAEVDRTKARAVVAKIG